MLLVNVCLIDKDWDIYQKKILQSFHHFYDIFNQEVFFYIVFQSKNIYKIDTIELEFLGKSFEIFYTDCLSVSSARNMGITYGKKHHFTRILFHDASLVYLPIFCQFIKHFPEKEILKSHFVFSDEHSIPDFYPISHDFKINSLKINAYRDMYVWSYCFNIKKINCYFDTNFGPGEYTRFKSGEDFLFMREFLKTNNIHEVLELSEIGIVHPARQNDYSKHLTYALGQGKIHQILLLEERNFTSFFNTFLFFGNALFRVLLFRKNSYKILMQRIIGFIDFNQ